MRRRHFWPVWSLALWTLCLGAVLSWCVLAQAPAATNAPASGATNTEVRLDQVNRNFIAENQSALTFGLDQVGMLQPTVLGHPLWQYVASMLYIGFAFLFAKVADWIISSLLKKWAERTTTQWDDIVISLFDGPVKVIVFVVLLNIGLQIFDWPAWVELWFSRATIFVVGVSIVLVLLKAVDAIILIWTRRLPEGSDRSFNESFLGLMGKMAKMILAIVALFTVLGSLGFDIRAALASVSVAGLALGLAAQDTVGNLFGAVAVFMDKPFRLGDRVRIGDVDGTVEEMGLRATRVRSLDGFLITVPNKSVGNATIINLTRRPTIKTVITIGLTYDTTGAQIRRAVQLVEDILKSNPHTHDYTVHFNRLADSSLNLEAVHLCKIIDNKVFIRVLQEINLAIKETFDREGLNFAYPTQTLYLRDERKPETEASRQA